MGPFVEPPVVPMHVSPVMTRPKKDSDVRRIVVDLSWPRGYSVNDGIHKNDYLGSPINLKLPTVDYMADIRALGDMYKLDLSRGYRQLRLDWIGQLCPFNIQRNYTWTCVSVCEMMIENNHGSVYSRLVWLSIQGLYR